MKRLLIVICLVIFVSKSINAQDSTRILTHEIGFNTVSLIKQVISNNPSSTLTQLPYDLFYNLYYKDLIGIRAGLGFNNVHNETPIFGQADPRTTDQMFLNIRAGLSYNFVRSKKITLNCFGDVVIEKNSLKTANTHTVRPSLSPVQTITETSSDILNGIGGQIGVGVKFNIIKHLSLYVEVPIVFVMEKTTSSSTTTDITVTPDPPVSIKNSSARIIIPTTVYLVLRF